MIEELKWTRKNRWELGNGCRLSQLECPVLRIQAVRRCLCSDKSQHGLCNQINVELGKIRRKIKQKSRCECFNGNGSDGSVLLLSNLRVFLRFEVLLVLII